MSILRYRRLSDLIAPIITAESQRRLDATLSDLRAKAVAASQTQQDLQRHFSQAHIDKANELLAAENAWRIRQWTEKILDEEKSFIETVRTAETAEIAPLG
jgi:hypothetical protein